MWVTLSKSVASSFLSRSPRYVLSLCWDRSFLASCFVSHSFYWPSFSSLASVRILFCRGCVVLNKCVPFPFLFLLLHFLFLLRLALYLHRRRRSVFLDFCISRYLDFENKRMLDVWISRARALSASWCVDPSSRWALNFEMSWVRDFHISWDRDRMSSGFPDLLSELTAVRGWIPAHRNLEASYCTEPW